MQLTRKPDLPSPKTEARDNLGPELVECCVKRPTRRTPSKQTGRRRLQEFPQHKNQQKMPQVRAGTPVLVPKQHECGTPPIASPVKDHPSSEIDLLACDSVVFVMHKNIPGVRFTVSNGDDETWILVIRKRQGRRSSSGGSGRSNSSDCDTKLEVGNAREIVYDMCDNTLGLCVRKLY